MEAFYKGLLDSLFDGVYFVDCERRISYWNKGAEYITGYAADEVIGKQCFENILEHVDDEGRSLCFDGCPLSQTLGDSQRREAEVYLMHKEGYRVPVSVRVAQIRDDSGHVVGAVEVFSNISAKKRTERRATELANLAFHDALTGIPNRRYGELKVQQAIQEIEQLNRCIGLLMVDLDHFKQVNDTYGHAIGDDVLRAVCLNISDHTRSENTVARWGGEELLLIVKDIREEDLLQFSGRLLKLISDSAVLHGGVRLAVTGSVGATIIQPTDVAQSAIQRADELMYKSKISGRNRVTLG
jgi:diguanylate cyclase (GGDEF)-like protein/PAS domain S-box-containing protein